MRIFNFCFSRSFGRLIFLLCLFFFKQESFAQLDSVKIFDPVFITATRSEKDPAETGRSISVIGNEKIENSLYTNVAELLSNEEGIYIPGSGQNPGNTQSIFTRGTNSNHTLIMIDGVRITDPSAVNNGLDLSELSLVNVERIEIIRGSHSTIYGTGAIGGAVNIITKKNLSPGFNGFAELKAGALNDKVGFSASNLLQENLFFNYSARSGWYTNINFVNLNVNGMDATMNLPVAPGTFDPQDEDDFSKLDAGVKLGFRNRKWDVFAAYKYTNQQSDIDDAEFVDDDNFILKFHRDQYNYGAKYSLSDKVYFQYSGGYSFMERQTLDDSSLVDFAGNYDKTYSDNLNRGSLFVNELQAGLELNGFKATLGIGRYSDYMTARSFYYSNSFGPPAFISEKNLDTLNINSSINHAFVYSDINGKLISEKLSRLSLGLGSRINNHTIFGNYVTYLINPSYKVNEDALLYFSVSTGFNAPSLYQLYNPDSFAKGNAKLNPETSQTFEVGFKQRLSNVSFQLSMFNTTVEDLIQYVTLIDRTTAITTAYTYINVSKLQNNGVELSVESKLNKNINLSGNFSAVNGKLTYSSGDINSDQIGYNDDVYLSGQKITSQEVVSLGLLRRPSYMANLSLRYFAGAKLDFAVNTKVISSRSDAYYDPVLFSPVSITLENYSLTDFQVSYNFSKNISVNFRVENVFDKEYIEIAGYNTRGRSYFLKLRYLFKSKQ